jgi:hypothetical protein
MQLACNVDVSFSYLRSAATASFDIKKFHRNCTQVLLLLQRQVVLLLHRQVGKLLHRQVGRLFPASMHTQKGGQTITETGRQTILPKIHTQTGIGRPLSLNKLTHRQVGRPFSLHACFHIQTGVKTIFSPYIHTTQKTKPFSIYIFTDREPSTYRCTTRQTIHPSYLHSQKDGQTVPHDIYFCDFTQKQM